jgi:hypothetical protein
VYQLTDSSEQSVFGASVFPSISGSIASGLADALSADADVLLFLPEDTVGSGTAEIELRSLGWSV